MKQNKSIAWNIFISVFFALLIATFAFSIYKFTRHAAPTEIVIYSAENYAADKPVSIILFARDAVNKTPLTDQNIELSVNGKAIPSIKTKEDGTALLVLKEYPKNLVVEARIGERVVKKYIGVGKYKDDLPKISKTVKPKTKPEIQLQTDKSFYAPDETIKGIIKSKLPEKTKIEIKSSLTFRVLEPIKKNDDSMFGPSPRECIRQQVHYKTIKAVTDSNGRLKFQLKLPKEFTKIDFREEDSICELSINTLNGSKQKLTKKITITTRPIRVKHLPQYSAFIPGCPRNIYVFVSDPVGNPLVAIVEILKERVETNMDGLAILEVPLTFFDSKKLDINVIDKIGNKTTYVIKFNYDEYPGAFILRTDKLIYKPTDIMLLDIITDTSGWRVFVNIEKDSKSLKFLALKLNNNKAHYEFEIPDDMSGLIKLNAFRIMPDGWRIQESHIIQVNQAGRKSCFASPGQMIRARFKSPVNAEFERANDSGKWEIKACSSYESRNKIFTKEKDIYGEKLFSIVLPVLFGIFLLLLVYFMRLWFYPSWNDYTLIISQDLCNKTRNNIFIAIPGSFTLTFAFLVAFGTMMDIESGEVSQADMFSKYGIVIVSSIVYFLILSTMLWRSFYVRDLLLEVPSDKGGDRIKKSVFLLPYLFVIFVTFEHSWIVASNFTKDIEWFPLLIFAFQGLVVIWLFCAYKIRNFYYTQSEYDDMLQYKSKKNMGLGTGLGAGLGAYQTSFFKTWIWGGALYWGVPVFIYLFIVIVIIAMFLPLTRIIECLG